MVKKIIAIVLVWKVFLIFLAYIAALFVPLFTEFIPKIEFRAGLPYSVWIWANFDGYHYISIAKHGYGHLQNPFLPLYPIFINLIYELTLIPHILIGGIISTISLILSLTVISKLVNIDFKKSLLPLLFLTILLYPTAFSYGSVYNDSLFLLFSVLSIYFARKKSFAMSCIIASFATLTRLNGLALFFFIFIEYLADYSDVSKTWDFKLLKKRLFSKNIIKDAIDKKLYLLLLIPLTFIGYLVFTEIKYGDWNLVFSSMKVWNQDKVTFPLQIFWRYFKIIFLYPTFKFNYFVAILELSSVIFYIAVVIYSFRRIRFSYWAFIVISLLIPTFTGTFAGMPRYALHLYPLFLGVAMFLSTAKLPIKIIYFTISFILLFIFIMFFTRGYFIT